MNNRDSAPKQAETTNKSREFISAEKLLARANGVDRQRLSI